jgi:hypothetical protein
MPSRAASSLRDIVVVAAARAELVGNVVGNVANLDLGRFGISSSPSQPKNDLTTGNVPGVSPF